MKIRWSIRRRWIAALAVLLCGTGAIAFVGTRPAAEEEVAVSWVEAKLRGRIDISERRLYVEENGEVIGSYAVAVGTSKHPTPRGSFTMRRIIWNPRWVPPNVAWAKGKKAREPGDPANPMGKVKIFFKEPDYYVHGTNAPETVGSAASHGCVRMRNADVIEFATLLMEHGGAPVEAGFVQRMINRVRSTREVRLSNPIPLRVTS